MNIELKQRVLSSIVLFPIVLFLIIKGSYFFSFLLLISLFIALYEWHFLSKNKFYYFFGFIFLFFSFFCMYKIRINNYNSYDYFIIILLICILTDIGGYIFGKIFKGPKLTSYSPNKTIAGLVGSYLFAICLIPFLLYFEFIDQNQIKLILIFVILISSISQIGDIVISFFKRKSNIKDTGKILPGHGGLLDRIDGMIFAFPFAYFMTLTNLADKI
jgi:phosphatidate cytidylyltransferase